MEQEEQKEKRAIKEAKSAANGGKRAEARAGRLEQMAESARREQTALLEDTPLEARYSAAFASYVQAKERQVERMEVRLETLIGRQSARLRQTQANKPGFFSRPRARAHWRQQVVRQQRSLQRLQRRLEHVNDIKEGMSLYGSRIEELATRKLRARQPGLASDWDDLQQARRRERALKHRQEKKRERTHNQEHARRHSLSLSSGR